MQEQEPWASGFRCWRDVMEETYHCSPTMFITSGKGRDNHDTCRHIWPFEKTRGHIHTASVCALWEQPALTLTAGGTGGPKAAALKSLKPT